MPADDTQTDTTKAEIDTTQQNQDAAKADPNAAETNPTSGIIAAADNTPLPSEPTFGDRVESEIEKNRRRFPQYVGRNRARCQQSHCMV